MIQAAIERVGISTVSISLLEEITKIIKPPRALFVPFDLGYPLDKPNDSEAQHKVIKASLTLFSRNDTPVFEKFVHSETL